MQSSLFFCSVRCVEEGPGVLGVLAGGRLGLSSRVPLRGRVMVLFRLRLVFGVWLVIFSVCGYVCSISTYRDA